eukprot:7664016-Pyramimonas_sp.AAC.1
MEACFARTEVSQSSPFFHLDEVHEVVEELADDPPKDGARQLWVVHVEVGEPLEGEHGDACTVRGHVRVVPPHQHARRRLRRALQVGPVT